MGWPNLSLWAADGSLVVKQSLWVDLGHTQFTVWPLMLAYKCHAVLSKSAMTVFSQYLFASLIYFHSCSKTETVFQYVANMAVAFLRSRFVHHLCMTSWNIKARLLGKCSEDCLKVDQSGSHLVSWVWLHIPMKGVKLILTC